MRYALFSRKHNDSATLFERGASLHDVDVWIPEHAAALSLKALQNAFPTLPKYNSRYPQYALRDLTDALNRLGQHAYHAYGDRHVRVLFLSGNTDHDMHLYSVLHPYIPEGCSIAFVDEQSAIRRWEFGNGTAVIDLSAEVTGLSGHSLPMLPKHLNASLQDRTIS